jgi:hypothetical protein
MDTHWTGESDERAWMNAAPVHIVVSEEYLPRLKSASVIWMVKPPKVMAKLIEVEHGYW